MAASVAAASLLPPMSPAAPKLNDGVGIVVVVPDADVAVGTRTAGALRTIIIEPRARSSLRRSNKLSSRSRRGNSQRTLDGHKVRCGYAAFLPKVVVTARSARGSVASRSRSSRRRRGLYGVLK